LGICVHLCSRSPPKFLPRTASITNSKLNQKAAWSETSFGPSSRQHSQRYNTLPQERGARGLRTQRRVAGVERSKGKRPSKTSLNVPADWQPLGGKAWGGPTEGGPTGQIYKEQRPKRVPATQGEGKKTLGLSPRLPKATLRRHLPRPSAQRDKRHRVFPSLEGGEDGGMPRWRNGFGWSLRNSFLRSSFCLRPPQPLLFKLHRHGQVNCVSNRFLLAGHSPGTLAHTQWSCRKSILSLLAAHWDRAKRQGEQRERLQIRGGEHNPSISTKTRATGPPSRAAALPTRSTGHRHRRLPRKSQFSWHLTYVSPQTWTELLFINWANGNNPQRYANYLFTRLRKKRRHDQSTERTRVERQNSSPSFSALKGRRRSNDHPKLRADTQQPTDCSSFASVPLLFAEQPLRSPHPSRR